MKWQEPLSCCFKPFVKGLGVPLLLCTKVVFAYATQYTALLRPYQMVEGVLCKGQECQQD